MDLVPLMLSRVELDGNEKQILLYAILDQIPSFSMKSSYKHEHIIVFLWLLNIEYEESFLLAIPIFSRQKEAFFKKNLLHLMHAYIFFAVVVIINVYNGKYEDEIFVTHNLKLRKFLFRLK